MVKGIVNVPRGACLPKSINIGFFLYSTSCTKILHKCVKPSGFFHLGFLTLSTSLSFFFSFHFILTLQYFIGFSIYQNESATGIHVFPILNPPPSSLLPPHTIPLGRPSAPAPSIQYCASNLDWRLVETCIISYIHPFLYLLESEFFHFTSCNMKAPLHCILSSFFPKEESHIRSSKLRPTNCAFKMKDNFNS